jgi:hypothetical protein
MPAAMRRIAHSQSKTTNASTGARDKSKFQGATAAVSSVCVAARPALTFVFAAQERSANERTSTASSKVPSRLNVTERAKQSSTHEYTLRRRGLTANELVTRLRASPGLA